MDDDQAHLRTLTLRCGMGVQVLSAVRVRHLGCDRTRFPCLLTNADCPQSRMPPLLLPPELPLIRSGVCSDSVCEEPLRRARQFAQALGPGGGQRWSLRGGGAATQTASVGLGGREQWPAKQCCLQIISLKLGEELFVPAGADVAPAAPAPPPLQLRFFFPCPLRPWNWGVGDRGEVRPRPEAPGPQMRVWLWLQWPLRCDPPS